MSFDREVEQYLCAAVLRPGSAQAPDGTLGVLCRLLALLRAAFPKARFLVRLDGGFASPEVFDFLDAEPRLDYVVAMAKNAVLLRLPSPSWWRPAPRICCVRRRRTSTSTPAIARTRGLVSAAW